MNPLEGISFYDAINRLVIGLLASLWVFYFLDDLPPQSDNLYYVAVYLISCYVFGLFFSLLVDKITECKHLGFLKIIFYKNNPKKIREITSKYNITIQEAGTSIPGYWRIYYEVQKNGLSDKVQAMETISAFMLNLCGLCFVCLIVSLVTIAFKKCPCELIWIPILSFFMVLFCSISRNYVECKIYTNILSAYKYLEEKQ